jgi:hypothetical protein
MYKVMEHLGAQECKRRILNEQMANSFGDVFLDLFQDIANLDQLITDLRKEKQRIQNLI